MTDRIHNFGAGPGVLPEPVLRQAQKDIWNIGGSGIGIAEHSHRGKVFDKIIGEAEEAARRLAGIPDNYKVLFVQGGATLQFAMVPMNLLPAGRTADYLLTGVWAEKALQEAKKFGSTHVAVSGEASKFTRIPAVEEIRYSSDPAYVHITTNNTIYGTEWKSEPPVPAGVPLIADTSSDIFSRPIDVSKYGLIYAGAQKNLGPSGIVLVIMRADLADAAPAALPTMLQYTAISRSGRCTTRRRRWPSIWSGKCSSGSETPEAWPRWPNATPRKPSCCTTSSTRARCSWHRCIATVGR